MRGSGSTTLIYPLCTINVLIPEEHEVGLEDVPEVVVPVDGRGGVEGNVAEHLHADDGVDEEQHHHQHHHIGQGLSQNYSEQCRHLLEETDKWRHKRTEGKGRRCCLGDVLACRINHLAAKMI